MPPPKEVAYLIWLEFAGRQCDGQEHNNTYWLSHLNVNKATKMAHEHIQIGVRSSDEAIL